MAGSVQRLSPDSSGGYEPSITADGRYVTFQGTVQGSPGLFVLDRTTGQVTSAADQGTTTNGYDFGKSASINGRDSNGSISADGSKLVFESEASLDAYFSNSQIFVEDRATGDVTLASTTSTGEVAGGDVSGAAISGDGTHVAFLSNASNLPGATGSLQVYVKDLLTGTLTLASSDSAGTPGARISANNAGGSTSATLSADGNSVLFKSNAPNLGSGSTGIYLKNLVDGTLTDVSAGFNFPADPSMSADASVVAYDGYDSSFHGGVFVTTGGVTTLASAAADGTAGNGYSTSPKLSADGKFVLFQSTATNLGPSDPAIDGTTPQTFIKDLTTGAVTLVFPKSGAETYSNPVTSGQIFSADDKTAVFATSQSDLASGDTNQVLDAFAYTLPAGDLIPPGLDTADVNGGTLTLTYTEALDALNGPASSAFAITVGGANDAVSAVAISGSTVSLTLATAVAAGQTVTLSYTDPTPGDDAKAIQDLAGNDAATLSGIDITNSTTAAPASGGGGGGGSPVTPGPVNPPTNNSPTLPPAPSIAADPSIAVSNGYVTISGQVSAGVTGVELFDGAADLGAATIDPTTNTWDFTVAPGFNAASGLVAVATDPQGRQSRAAVPFDLSTGVTGEPYRIVQDSSDPVTGALTGSRFLKANGTLYLASSIATEADGSFTATYSDGTFFRGKPYASFADSYDADGNLTQHVETNRDGTHAVEVDGRGVVTHARGQDTFAALGSHTTFVFDAGVGHELITGFQLGGRGHDLVSLPESDAGRLAGILAHAHEDAFGDVTISLGHGDTITFAGVSADAMRQHAGDFRLHG